MPDDYYKVLGVERNASPADIQKAYRALARKYHPDLNPDDKTTKRKFQEVQQAFDVLNDTSKRELYDRYGSAFEQMGPGGPRPGPGGAGARGQPGWQATSGGAQGFNFSDIFGGQAGDEGGAFSDLFAQFRRGAEAEEGQTAARGAAKRRGADARYELTIPFVTAANGGEAQLALQRGNAKLEKIAVKIPAGIDDGQSIRLRGQGEPGRRGAAAGDLLITVRVEPHPHFHRKDHHLHVKVPISLGEAALGAKIEIPTPRGSVTITIPAGASSGTKLRVRGQGISPVGKPAGDLFAELQIVLPKTLDAESLEQLRQIEQRYPLEPRRDLRW